MPWAAAFDDAFAVEFADFPETVQDELLAHTRALAEFGPALGQPRVGTLKGSRHANMKELRFGAPAEYGGLPLRSMPGAGQFCSSPATRGACRRCASTEG
jgi:hypothetical protein